MSVVKERDFFISGGTLPPGSLSYIERRADADLLNNLVAGKYCYVLNARQMGKSSLSVRAMARLAERGILSVFIDLTQIGGRNVQPAQWYRGLAGVVGDALDLTEAFFAYEKAHADLSPMQRFFGAIAEVVLKRTTEPIVIFIDEIDATRNFPFDTDEFFAGIRECFNRRVRDPAFARLTFCLLGVAVPNDLIQNPVTTPFNIGERIRVEDFNLDEVRSFDRALGENGDALARRVHYWTGGQPFLTQTLCQSVVAENIDSGTGVDSLVARLFFDPKALATNPNLADVGNRALKDLEHGADPDRFRADVLSAYDRALRGKPVIDDESNRVAVVLKLSGLTRADGQRLIVRNRIYRHVFGPRWIQANMPGQELIRQRQSFIGGLMRGVAVTAVVCALVGSMGVLALQARARAELAEAKAVAAEHKLDSELYVSDMNSLRLFDESGNSGRMSAILDRWLTSPHRGFEWYFWMGRLHDSTEEYTLDYDEAGRSERACMTPDGKLICILDYLLNEAVVFDRATHRPLGIHPFNREMVVATDVGILHFGQGPAPLKVTNIATGRVVRQIGTSGYESSWPAWRLQGNYVALNETKLADYHKHIIEVVNLVTGQTVCRIANAQAISEFGISRDGRRLWIKPDLPRPSNAPTVAVWDCVANREIDRFPFPPRTFPVNMSASGRLVAYLDENRRVQIRDVDAKKAIFSMPDSVDEAPIAVEIANDDRSMSLVTSEGVGTIRALPSGRPITTFTNVWQLTPGNRPSEWIAGSSTVRILSVNSGARGAVARAHLLARDGQGSIRMTSEHETTVQRLLESDLTIQRPIQAPAGAIDFTYNDLWGVVPINERTSEIVALDGRRPPIRIPMRVDNFSAGRTTDRMVLMDTLRTYHGYDARRGKILWTRRYSPDWRSFWLSPDGSRLVACTLEGTLAILDPASGNIIDEVKAHHRGITLLRFSQDGRFFVTAGGDGAAILWDTQTMRRLAAFRGNGAQEVEGVDISTDDRRVATCNRAGEWDIWDAATGEELTEMRGSVLPLRSIAFSTDGKSIVTADDDGFVRIWRGREDDPTIRIPIPK